MNAFDGVLIDVILIVIVAKRKAKWKSALRLCTSSLLRGVVHLLWFSSVHDIGGSGAEASLVRDKSAQFGTQHALRILQSSRPVRAFVNLLRLQELELFGQTISFLEVKEIIASFSYLIWVEIFIT